MEDKKGFNREAWIEGAKVIFHPEWIRRWRKNPFSVMPIYLEVSPAGMCNHRCVICAPEMLNYPNRFLPLNAIKRVLKELKEVREEDPDGLGVKSIQYAGEGEPTLHKNFAEIVYLTREAGIDVGMLTNGTGLNAKLAEKIIPLVNGFIQFSINAGTKNSYAKLHRTTPDHWDLVWTNIARAVKIRAMSGAKDCDLGVNMTVLIHGSVERNGSYIPPNWPEVEDLVKKARDSGVNYMAIKPYSQHPYSASTAKHYGEMSYKNMMSDMIQTIQNLKDRYSSPDFEIIFRESRFREYEEDKREYRVCNSVPTIWSYIQSDGLWLSCSSFWTDSRFVLGNILTQSVRQIWFGNRRREHLDFILSRGKFAGCGLDIEECRQTCHPDKENRLLARLSALTDEDFERALGEFAQIPRPKRANFI
ncbi:MAG: radical SAM/SPASM domain-containing protein [Patescibacteria group bacterium]